MIHDLVWKSAPRSDPVRLVGAHVRRVEDPRLIQGQVRYVDDLQFAGNLHLAFVMPRTLLWHLLASFEGFVEIDSQPAEGRPPCSSVGGRHALLDPASRLTA